MLVTYVSISFLNPVLKPVIFNYVKFIEIDKYIKIWFAQSTLDIFQKEKNLNLSISIKLKNICLVGVGHLQNRKFQAPAKVAVLLKI